MIFLSILILIVAIALPSVDKQITPILYIRISSIVFIYAGALSFNALYIQSIGSGIGIYSGLFQVTTVSQLLDTSFYGLYSQSIVSGTGDSSEFLQVSASLFGITNPTGTLASEEPTIETPSSNNQIYDKNKTNIDQTELENVLGSAIDEGNTQELLYTWSHRG